jgi:hypothetical protein
VARYRPVPAQIVTMDYVGVTTAESEKYRKLGELELDKLEGQVLRGDLSQGVRRAVIGDNVIAKCTVCFNIKQVEIFIGEGVRERTEESSCYCCSPGLVAGMIVTLKAPLDESLTPPQYVYSEEKDYHADVLVCQAPNNTMPRRMTVIRERVVGSRADRETRTVMNQTYGGHIVYDVPFADHSTHYREGQTVLLLVQPYFDPRPYPGTYVPCINNRLPVSGATSNPWPEISSDWLNSTGMSCGIMMDKQVWDEEVEPFTGEIKWKPFRILPIGIESCL